MPQFDTTFFESQIFWTIISFAILFIVLNKWVLPPIIQILKKRALTIEQDINHAQATRVEAETIKALYTSQLSNVRQEAEKIINDARGKAQQERTSSILALEQEQQKQRQAFIHDTEDLQKTAAAEVRKQSAQLILAAAEQLVRHQFNEKDAQEELDHAIRALAKDFKQH